MPGRAVRFPHAQATDQLSNCCWIAPARPLPGLRPLQLRLHLQSPSSLQASHQARRPQDPEAGLVCWYKIPVFERIWQLGAASILQDAPRPPRAASSEDHDQEALGEVHRRDGPEVLGLPPRPTRALAAHAASPQKPPSAGLKQGAKVHHREPGVPAHDQ